MLLSFGRMPQPPMAATRATRLDVGVGGEDHDPEFRIQLQEAPGSLDAIAIRETDVGEQDVRVGGQEDGARLGDRGGDADAAHVRLQVDGHGDRLRDRPVVVDHQDTDLAQLRHSSTLGNRSGPRAAPRVHPTGSLYGTPPRRERLPQRCRPLPATAAGSGGRCQRLLLEPGEERPDFGLQTGLGLVAELPFGPADVRVGDRHVTGLERLMEHPERRAQD